MVIIKHNGQLWSWICQACGRVDRRWYLDQSEVSAAGALHVRRAHAEEPRFA
jgi:hypothetical protein